jgi:hypothetical protein
MTSSWEAEVASPTMTPAATACSQSAGESSGPDRQPALLQ